MALSEVTAVSADTTAAVATRPTASDPRGIQPFVKGDHCYVGSTKKAWVGLDDMRGADWIVTDYLGRVLEGASIGRAFLESKQDNPGSIRADGS